MAIKKSMDVSVLSLLIPLGFIMGLVITTANIGERAGAELVMGQLGNRFSRLTKILADQGFDGVDFIAKMENTFKIQWEIVVQVL